MGGATERKETNVKKRIQILLWTVALAAIAVAATSTALACDGLGCITAPAVAQK